MRRTLFASLIVAAAALAAQSGAELFQKALTAERAAGNLEEAISLYQRIAKEFGSDRALAAKAIMQEARCYEKLGQNKAIQLYEQLAREYKDQPEPSAAASARLAALKLGDHPAGPAVMSQRKIAVPFSIGRTTIPNADGRREVYVDASTGALMISDLAGKDKRTIYKPKAGEQILSHLASRDLSAVFFTSWIGDGYKRAAVKTDGTGYRELEPEPGSIPDWSWDNRYLFVCRADPDGTTQLWRESMLDGEIRKVPVPCGAGPVLSRPSPDGRFIALSESFYAASGRVSIVSSQGGEPQLVSDHARAIDWTRDGRYLILASAPSGVEGIYLLPVRDGHGSGEPILLRYGPCAYGSVNADGSLVCSSTSSLGAAWLGTLDQGDRPADWRELNVHTCCIIGWSPDSSRIVYQSFAGGQPDHRFVLHVYNIASGEDRELYRGDGSDSCAWPDGAKLFCMAYNHQPPAELLSVSMDDGSAESLGSVPGVRSWVVLAGKGGQSIYITRQPGDELVRWDAVTRQATTVDRLPGYYVPNLLPRLTERWLARRNKESIEIRPMEGGEWRPFISLPATHMAFTPDGNWFLFHDVDTAGKHGLYRASTAGGKPERLGDFPSVRRDRGALYVSPDGRKLLAEASADPELWILENFEPKQTAAR